MNLPLVPKFDDLYVVSDIHMGGSPGFQILKNGPRLGKLLQQLAGENPNNKVGLVLNGDVIDSLAEDQIDGYLAVDSAERMMQRLYSDPAFKPVWDGLAQFAQTDKRHLIFVLGNHDIELSLSPVELSIRRRLAGSDRSANGRILFATRGSGFGCQVGNARVFCTHGNEVDGWNVVDHDDLRELENKLNAGRRFVPSEWTPNAGTRFVIDVMNRIKRKHPFIDLLKPETNTVFPVLLTLDPESVKAAKDGLPIVKDRIWGELRARGLLSADADSLDEAEDAAVAGVAEQQFLGPSLKEAVHGDAGVPGGSVDDELLEVEKDFRKYKSATEAARHETSDATLGWFDMVVDRIRRVDKVEALRRALKDWLQGDDSFLIGKRDDTFDKIVAQTGADVDFIVTGHTHLERAIQIEEGVERFYYNTGTWVRIIKLTDELLDKTKFDKVWQALSVGTMDALDKAKVDGKLLVLNQATMARISTQGNGVVGQLFHVKDADAGGVDLKPVTGSKFTRR